MNTTMTLLEASPMTATDTLGTLFDSEKVLEKLKATYEPLNAANEVVAREDQEKQQAAERRDEAIEAWTDIYQGVASSLCGLYRLAGRSDLADRYQATDAKAEGRDGDDDDAPSADAS